MGQVVFQATLGGQTNLVGPNTASTYNINVPTVNGTLVTTGDTATVTSTMIDGPVTVAKGGTGQSSYTDGQLLIGNSTGNTLTKTTLTAGAGIGITNGSGSITISNTASPSGGTAATGSVTLTSSSNPVYSITPSTWGQTVTLPDATTVAEITTNYSLSNKSSNYSMRILNNSGTLLGFLDANTTVLVGLEDNSTSAGVWNLVGANIYGTSAEYINNAQVAYVGSNDTQILETFVELDSDRQMYIFSRSGGAGCYAIVYNKTTQTWGTLATVTADNSSTIQAEKIDTDKVLIATSGSNGVSVVVLTTSSTTITVGTAATANVGVAHAASGIGRIVICGSSYVFVVHATGAPTGTTVYACTVSGTTVTLGTSLIVQTATSSTAYYGMGIFKYSDTRVVIACRNSSASLQLYLVSISGTTLGNVTSSLLNTGTGPLDAYSVELDTGVYLQVYGAVTTFNCTARIVTTNGTTFTNGTPLQLTTQNYTTSNQFIVCKVSATKVMGFFNADSFLYTLNISGTTITANSLATNNPGVSANNLFLSAANELTMLSYYTASSRFYYGVFDVSGTTATIKYSKIQNGTTLLPANQEVNTPAYVAYATLPYKGSPIPFGNSCALVADMFSDNKLQMSTYTFKNIGVDGDNFTVVSPNYVKLNSNSKVLYVGSSQYGVGLVVRILEVV